MVRRKLDGKYTTLRKFTPSTRWRRLLIEWGVINHIWTRRPLPEALSYTLRIFKTGGKHTEVYAPRWY